MVIVVVAPLEFRLFKAKVVLPPQPIGVDGGAIKEKSTVFDIQTSGLPASVIVWSGVRRLLMVGVLLKVPYPTLPALWVIATENPSSTDKNGGGPDVPLSCSTIGLPFEGVSVSVSVSTLPSGCVGVKVPVNDADWPAGTENVPRMLSEKSAFVKADPLALKSWLVVF
jgi:hypothetical protein